MLGRFFLSGDQSSPTSDVSPAAFPELAPDDEVRARFDHSTGPQSRTLRQEAARGTIINGVFRVGLAGLTLLRRLIVASLLTASQFGLWGVILATLMAVLFLKDAGISDKFVQQSEPDQEIAFQKAFTIELLLTAVFMTLAAAALPLFALAYGRTDIIAPGLVLSLAVLGSSLQAPIWVYYRQMRFVRQRTLEAVDPGVTFVVTIALAIAGAGVWSLIIGAVAGAWVGAAVALRLSPYRVRFRLERGTGRDYFRFSWPLVVASGSGMLVVQGSVLIGSYTVGLAGVGAIGLAGAIAQFSRGVDNIVTQTLYPAICAVRNQGELLFEAFVKSNRLALMWGVPFGIGLALFASDLVSFVLGDQWRPAIVLLQAFGVIAAAEQVGFNWTAFLRARNHTRPLALIGLVTAVAFFVVTAPLLVTGGLPGYALGMLVTTAVGLALRTFFLARLFSGFRMVRHALRAVVPTVPAAAVVLVMRLFEAPIRTPALAVLDLAIFVLVTLTVTLVWERSLLLEVRGYLRSGPPPEAGIAAGSGVGATGRT